MTSRKPSQYAECRQEFSSIFYQNNLDLLANGKDLGLDDMEQFDNKFGNFEGQQPFQLNNKSPIPDKPTFGREKQTPYLSQVFHQHEYCKGESKQSRKTRKDSFMSSYNKPTGNSLFLRRNHQDMGQTPQKGYGQQNYDLFKEERFDKFEERQQQPMQPFVLQSDQSPMNEEDSISAFWQKKKTTPQRLTATYEQFRLNGLENQTPQSQQKGYNGMPQFQNQQQIKQEPRNPHLTPYHTHQSRHQPQEMPKDFKNISKYVKTYEEPPQDDYQSFQFRKNQQQSQMLAQNQYTPQAVAQIQAIQARNQNTQKPTTRQNITPQKSVIAPQGPFLSSLDPVQTKNLQGRKSRGLRMLSLKVRDIVFREKKSSYKEVAEKLIENLNVNIGHPFNAKEEQNIKRRVYDALNVLIAANVLKKNGKTVYCDEEICQPKDALDRIYNKDEKKKLILIIEEKKKVIEKKKKKLQKIIFKSLAIQNLIDRNKKRHLEEKKMMSYHQNGYRNRNPRQIRRPMTESNKNNENPPK